MITTTKLNGIIPTAILNELNLIATKFNITTNLRLAHFLSQADHESDDFKFLQENLNYNEAGLNSEFAKLFPNGLAAQYAHQPIKIGNHIYANRMGNGNEASGDGYKFHGRGAIQLTGHDNYKHFSDFIGEDCVANPDLVATKYPLSSAAFFFNSNNLWYVCDLGATDDVVEKVTRHVNGGVNGLDDRITKFHKYYNLLQA